jgi:anaerobic selenocysteine-containing dehydrogenase
MAKSKKTRLIRTVCPAHCGIDACGILAHVKQDRVVKVEPAEFPDPRHRRICLRGLSSLDITYHPDRLKFPMKRKGLRGKGEFERISWDEAFESIAKEFKKIADKYGWRSIGWALGGPGSGTTKYGAYVRLASMVQATRISTWGYGDAALPCGSRALFGTHLPYRFLMGKFLTERVSMDTIVVWGTNPAETQPLNMMRKIMDAKENGALLVVIDPRFTVTASKADQYLGIRPGTDAALALGLMHVIFQKGLQDNAFIKRYTVGPYLVRADNGKFLRGKEAGVQDSQEYVVWDIVSDSPKLCNVPEVNPTITGTYQVNGIGCKPAFQLLTDLAKEYSPEKTSEITGISTKIINKLATRIGGSKRVTFITNMGLTRTYHGDISLRGLGTVATVTGNVTVTFPSGYLSPVLNWQPFLNPDPGRASHSRLGILQLYDAVIVGRPYPIKAVWFAFINFLNQCVYSTKIANEIFPRLDLIVVADLFMTPTARYADILLPACSYLEFSDLIPFPFPYVQLQQKVIEPLYESRSDVNIVSGLAEKLGLKEYFDQGEEGFIDLILNSRDLSVNGITREQLKEGPVKLKPFSDFEEDLDNPCSTPSGKIEFYSEKLSEVGQALPVYLEPLETPINPEGRRYPLSFIQGHSRFRTHSMFANSPSLLEMNPEPVVEINPLYAADRDISDNDLVTVFNDRGKATLKASLTGKIRPGVINIAEGWWIEQFREGSVNHLTHDVINPVQEMLFEPNMHMNDVAVEVKRVEEESK